MEEVTSELNDEEVDSNNDNPDKDESGVAEEVFEDVNFIVDLSGSNHVDNLEPDEQVEDEGHVTGSVTVGSKYGSIVVDLLVKFITIKEVLSTWEDHIILNDIQFLSPEGEAELLLRLRDHVFTTEKEDEKNNHLEEGHVDNVLGHLARDDKVILVLRRAVKKIILGEFSGKSERRKRIHDHVNPKKLDSLKGRFLKEDSADNSEDESVDIDGKLELQETLDVIIDVSSPTASLDDGFETIISDDNISGSLANRGSGNTHTEADIGLGKSGSIVGTITSDSNNLVHLHETGNKEVLIFGSRSGHNLQLCHEGLELCEVSDSFFTLLGITFTIVRGFLTASLANKSTHISVELWALHAY